MSPNKLVFRLELGQQSGCSITLQVLQAAVPEMCACAAQRGGSSGPPMGQCRCRCCLAATSAAGAAAARNRNPSSSFLCCCRCRIPRMSASHSRSRPPRQPSTRCTLPSLLRASAPCCAASGHSLSPPDRSCTSLGSPHSLLTCFSACLSLAGQARSGGAGATGQRPAGSHPQRPQAAARQAGRLPGGWLRRGASHVCLLPKLLACLCHSPAAAIAAIAPASHLHSTPCPASFPMLQDRFLVEALAVGPEVQQASSELFKAHAKAVRQAAGGGGSLAWHVHRHACRGLL